MSLKAFSAAIAILGFSLSSMAATSSCYSDQDHRTQVGTVFQDSARDILTLNLTKPISSEDTSTQIPAGTYDLNDDQAMTGIFGCHDGVQLTTNLDESEGGGLYVGLEVLCDLHPKFPVYNFSLVCE